MDYTHSFHLLLLTNLSEFFFHIPMQAEIFHIFSKMGAYYFARRWFCRHFMKLSIKPKVATVWSEGAQKP